jgi:hypothetical protein
MLFFCIVAQSAATGSATLSFFRCLDLEATQVAQWPDAIRRLRAEEYEAILLRGVYPAAFCASLCERLRAGQHGLVQSSFPPPFRSHFYGINLNLAAPDLVEYFRAAPLFGDHLVRLFAGEVDLATRMTGLLALLDEGRRYRAAPGPQPGLDHMFATLRVHLPGGFIPRHFDNEQASRASFRLIVPQLAGDIYSYVLAFSRAEAGGELEIFNLRHEGRRFRMADGTEDAAHLDVTGVESVRVALAPGEMIIFNSGRFLHRVTPVVGATPRWTACSFMAESRDGEALCWG